VRHGVYLAPHGRLADPVALAELACTAEQAGWDGVFLWDHMWRPSDRPQEVADAWICLAAIAARTATIRLGPMVTPLARRRPHKVAREAVTLDHLSGGRLVLGVGLGVNTGNELGRFGEEVDDRLRGDALDEALAVVVGLWSGEPVRHRGAHFVVDDVRFVPTPVQKPRIPLWGAARGGAPGRTLRRAAGLDGIFPVRTSLDQLGAMLGAVRAARGSLDGFDVAMDDATAGHDELERAGVTWAIRSFPEDAHVGAVRDALDAGPRP